MIKRLITASLFVFLTFFLFLTLLTLHFPVQFAYKDLSAISQKPLGLFCNMLFDKDNYMIYVGIDPGADGAIAFVDQCGTTHFSHFMPPTITELRGILSNVRNIVHVYLEYAQAMPKQGVTSMFNYGKHFGSLEALLALEGYPYTLVRPRLWQATMFKGMAKDNPKEVALKVAQRLYPGDLFLKTPKCKTPHKGIIDAKLIAECCRREMK